MIHTDADNTEPNPHLVAEARGRTPTGEQETMREAVLRATKHAT